MGLFARSTFGQQAGGTRKIHRQSYHFPRVKKSRSIFSLIALLAGIGLIYFELTRRGDSGAFEFNFWLVVGALLIFLALLDLFGTKTPPQGPS